MRTQPVVPGRIDFDAHGVPFAPGFADVHRLREGALAHSRHVFVRGNRLPERWRGRARFAVLETGFGLGHNFLALWDAWRADAQRCSRLHVVSIEQHPPRASDLARAHAASPLRELALQLHAQWPPSTPNLHRLVFDDGKVELLLLFADVADAVREIVGRFDAFLLDGFMPASNPAMWQPRVLSSLARLAAPGATLATRSVAHELRDSLAAAGFAVERAPGFGGRHDMTVATFAPRHRAPPLPGRAPANGARDVAVLGGGLAGSAVAHALAHEGFDVALFDDAAPAAGSRQRGGLFHGIVHRDDGPHARFTRAAALVAERALGAAIARGMPGCSDGFLRVASAQPDAQPLRDLIAAQALPASYVRLLDARDASALAGVDVPAPAWLYPGGGWIDPRALCAHWSASSTLHARAVTALRRDGERWALLDMSARVVAHASNVVLAAGAHGRALLGALGARGRLVRGQTTWLPAHDTGLRAPLLPLADAGYAFALPDGSVLAGASSQPDEDDMQPRLADQQANLERLQRLTGSRVAAPLSLDGEQVGLRLQSIDRLPWIGALPDPQSAPAARRDAPRFVARLPGLYVCSALGSRGITWAPLAARLLAAQLAGSPWPLEASLADAVDPARFAARDVRGLR
jgi:tRNA 5-methylaminomethyl-2-thiouridine biosynthesis bifunctional protein